MTILEVCYSVLVGKLMKQKRILTVHFVRRAGVDYSPGEKFLITQVVVTFTHNFVYIYHFN